MQSKNRQLPSVLTCIVDMPPIIDANDASFRWSGMTMTQTLLPYGNKNLAILSQN